jgi:hypothetical protein
VIAAGLGVFAGVDGGAWAITVATRYGKAKEMLDG